MTSDAFILVGLVACLALLLVRWLAIAEDDN